MFVNNSVKSDGEILEHDKWFGRYCEYKKLYKAAIAEWKSNLNK